MTIRTVAFLSDFGHEDPWVGETKGRIRSLAPDAIVHDFAHGIAPGDVAAGAFHVAGAILTWPPGTILLAVCDPGVGSLRRAIAARVGRGANARYFVGPDNGLLSDLPPGEEIVAHEIRGVSGAPPRRGTTFDGRDLFAPAAAALVRGDEPESMGPHVARTLRLPELPASAVWYVDRFGNAITNAPPAPARAVEIAGREFPVRGPVASYADAAPGEIVLLVSSRGTLEAALAGASFAARAGLVPGGGTRGVPVRFMM